MLTVYFLTGTLLSQTPNWLLGGEGALLLRDEAGAQRTAMASVGPRVSYAMGDFFQLAAMYRFAYHLEGSALKSSNFLSRGALLAEGRLEIAKTAFLLGAGPIVSHHLHQLSSSSGGPTLSSQVWDMGLASSVGLQKQLGSLVWRTGVEVFFFFPRTDVSVSLGVLFPLGAQP